MAKIGIFTCVP